MKNKIDRTLFLFGDGADDFYELSSQLYGLGTLLTRLMNEKYTGAKIKFINLYFYTLKTFEFFPIIPKDSPYFFGGHLTYYGVINKEKFDQLNLEEQHKYVWSKGREYIGKIAESMKNQSLLEASEYAYKMGLAIGLNPDYRMVEADLTISGKNFRASVWVKFRQEGMYANFTLEDGDKIVYEKEIDRTKNGVEIFLVMYKSIELNKNYIVIKGRRDVEGLPFKIPIKEIIINN